MLIILDLLWAIFGGGYVARKCVKDHNDMNKPPFWYTEKNYNLDRQRELEFMCTFEKQKVAELLGRPFRPTSVMSVRSAVEELLSRENIDYYDPKEAHQAWRSAAGVEPKIDKYREGFRNVRRS